LDNKLVRQALYQAIDREAMAQQVFFGLAIAARSAITQDIPWAYNREVDLTRQYPYNPQRANELLDRAGFPRGADGRRMRPAQFTNGAGYCNPAVDRLFEQGAAEAENRARAPHYYELQKVLADELPILPLLHLESGDLGSRKFEYETTLWRGAAIYAGWGKLY